MVIGYLSPEGEFTECASFDHLRRAQYICRKLGVITKDGFEAERYLLNKGYVVFRARDVYMKHVKDTDGSECPSYIYLTEAQLAFINEHQEKADWNNTDQAESVRKMLEWE